MAGSGQMPRNGFRLERLLGAMCRGGCACLCVFVCALVTAGGEKDHLLRMPTGVLLVGYGPTNLTLTTPVNAIHVQPAEAEPSSWDHMILPSLSRDGRMVATAHLHGPGRETIATYSVAERAWKEYASVFRLWSVSLSPDGGTLAFVSAENGARPLLNVLETATGRVRNLLPTPVSEGGVPSWSPDSARIAYQTELPWRDELHGKRDYEIRVVDVKTGAVSRVASGQNPSWSPSGEWIAYLDLTGEPGGGTKCMVTRPDGTGTQTLFAFPRRHAPFFWAPVWSPDSNQLLLNEIADWNGWKVKIDLLDFQTHLLTSKLHSDGTAVLGWARYTR